MQEMERDRKRQSRRERERWRERGDRETSHPGPPLPYMACHGYTRQGIYALRHTRMHTHARKEGGREREREREREIQLCLVVKTKMASIITAAL